MRCTILQKSLRTFLHLWNLRQLLQRRILFTQSATSRRFWRGSNPFLNFRLTPNPIRNGVLPSKKKPLRPGFHICQFNSTELCLIPALWSQRRSRLEDGFQMILWTSMETFGLGISFIKKATQRPPVGSGRTSMECIGHGMQHRLSMHWTLTVVTISSSGQNLCKSVDNLLFIPSNL